MPARVFATILMLAALGGADNTASEREVTVPLKGTAPEGEVRIGYSSPRRIEVERTVPRFLFEVPKFSAKDPIFFRIAMGETRGVPFYGALDRSPGTDHYDLLYLDRDRDLDLTNDGEPKKARVRTLWTIEGKIVEFLDVNLDLPYTIDGKERKETYHCVFFYVLEKKTKGNVPEAMLVERDGWREGTVELNGVNYTIALIDDDSDGIFSTGDAWVLKPAEGDRKELLARDVTRSMLFPAWSSDQKWTVEVESVETDGTSAKLKIVAAKETERDYFVRVARQRQSAEERSLKIDPLRPKAKDNAKVNWLVGKDIKYARDITSAERTPSRLLLAFDAKNCRWCRMMDKYTFRDREVVQLCKKFVCAKIAFRQGAPDPAKYEVAGTPTYIVVGQKGGEIARHVGFLRPTDFAAWLKSALR